MKRAVSVVVAALMVVGLTSAFAPAAMGADAVPTPSASGSPQGADAVPGRDLVPGALPGADAVTSTDAIPGTDAVTSRSLKGHIDLGAAGHPATAGDVTITLFGWIGADQNEWIHYTQEWHPDAAGDFTLALGQFDYVILQYDYTGTGNFASAYSGEFLPWTPGGNPGGYHLTKPVTTVQTVLAVGGSITGTVLSTGLASGTVLTASALPSEGTPRTPRLSRAVVQSDHSYLLTGLPAGTYSVEITSTSPSRASFDQSVGGTAAHPEGVSKTLAAGGQVTFPPYTMTLEGQVSGHVDCGLDCLEDKRSSVSLQAFDPPTSSWLTQAAGPLLTITGSEKITFTFAGLLPGTYRVAVDYLGSNNYGDLVTEPFDLRAGDSKQLSLALVRNAIPAPGVPSSASSFITALYVDFLNRRPSSGEVAFWGAQLATGAPRSAVAAGFVNSDEYRMIRIDAAYTTVLKRTSDPGGRVTWLTEMQAGRITTDDIERTFYASDEYFLQQGGTRTSWVAGLYKALLGRTGSSSEYAFWADLAAQHGRPWVISQFWDSTETISSRVSAMYVSYLGRQPDTGGLATWVGVALALGDSGLRSALTSSDEYFARSAPRFPQ